MRPEFQWEDGLNGIKYSLDVAGFIKTRNVKGELTGATLDVMLMHEIGHSPQASMAFGYRYSRVQTYSNEFDVVRNVENPYRSYQGTVGLRKTYNGYPVPSVQPLE
ncbi:MULTISPECIES: hypothetical protein [unclassified Rhodanobacter]|uniref:hypothetical protein n=1 Tax=unclassified Rhodanobacter TaxID=2621553 RepID=UPI000A9591A4|nr:MULTISPECIES: hypothetical protein [unclassified Rhodanobacter]